ncbi:hypothetical protein Rhe02_49500 [Rhizocola hellebori]|uniref:Secreted protein n=2 Tax=Rhizocola hellebori TaxID=1392758 RepID=A0A8J3VIF6_9ACTN|nr:hypothetical protein Rhe02_49500 [Rhizocola hellebori]
MFASAVLSSAFLAVQVAPAQAAGGCSAYSSGSNAAVANCWGKPAGTSFKGVARCQNFSSGAIHDRYGPKRAASLPPGATTSSAYCLSNEEYLGLGNGGLGYLYPAV